MKLTSKNRLKHILNLQIKTGVCHITDNLSYVVIVDIFNISWIYLLLQSSHSYTSDMNLIFFSTQMTWPTFFLNLPHICTPKSEIMPSLPIFSILSILFRVIWLSFLKWFKFCLHNNMARSLENYAVLSSCHDGFEKKTIKM